MLNGVGGSGACRSGKEKLAASQLELRRAELLLTAGQSTV
jgi:hypothetical protein